MILCLGSTFLGYLDYWSGLLSTNVTQYNVDDVLNSTAAEILSQLNGHRVTSDLMISLRNNLTVKCNFEKNIKPCLPFKKPCLFHITKDPCEQVNLNYNPSKNMRKFVQQKIDYFEISLNKFTKSASKPRNVRGTKDANPYLYNNTWTNWEDSNHISVNTWPWSVNG